MKLELHMSLDNDSFAADPGAEAGRVLRGVAQNLRENGASPDRGIIRLIDSNGNRVGYAVVIA